MLLRECEVFKIIEGQRIWKILTLDKRKMLTIKS